MSVRVVKNSKCMVAGCNGLQYTNGYCQKHYKQVHIKGNIVTKDKHKGKCLCTECSNEARIRGYCQKHYQQIRRH